MKRPLGYLIRHRTLRSCVALAEIPWKEMPFNPLYGIGGACPTCGLVHLVRTYHLNVTDDGSCVVSSKVFDNMCRAGLIDGVPEDMLMVPNGGRPWKPLLATPFEFVDKVEPPPLNIGFGGKQGTVVRDGEGRLLYRPLMRIVNMHEDYGE